MSREAMKLALDALENAGEAVYARGGIAAVGSLNIAAQALRQALETEKQWVGLTKEDMLDCDNPMFDTDEFYAGMVWAEAKLKEKNQ